MLFIDQIDHKIQEPEELYPIVDSISLADIEPNTILRIIEDPKPNAREFIASLKKGWNVDPAEDSLHPKHNRWLSIYQALRIHTAVVDQNTSYGGDGGSSFMINESINLLENDVDAVSIECAEKVFGKHGYHLDDALVNFALGETRGAERIDALKNIYQILLDKIRPYENIPNLDQEIMDAIHRVRLQAKVFDILVSSSEY